MGNMGGGGGYTNPYLGANQMMVAYQNMQRMNYQNQLNAVFAQNQILANPLVGMNRDRLLFNMKKEEEMEMMKRLKNQIDAKEYTEKDLMKMIILKPVELPDRKTDAGQQKLKELNKGVETQYEFVDSTWKDERSKYEKRRDNRPYKIIIADRDDHKKMLEKERQWQETNDDTYRPRYSDLIVHKVTNADKEGVDDEYDDKKNRREELDDENRVVYCEKNKTKHKKDFDYKHTYIYRIKIDDKNHVELKDNRIAYYEREQKKIEDNKKKTDEMLRQMAECELLDKELLEKGIEKIDDSDEDIDDDVDEIMTSLGLRSVQESTKKSKERTTSSKSSSSSSTTKERKSGRGSSTSSSSKDSKSRTSTGDSRRRSTVNEDDDDKEDEVVRITLSGSDKRSGAAVKKRSSSSSSKSSSGSGMRKRDAQSTSSSKNKLLQIDEDNGGRSGAFLEL
jgi:hypothetical protein